MAYTKIKINGNDYYYEFISYQEFGDLVYIHLYTLGELETYSYRKYLLFGEKITKTKQRYNFAFKVHAKDYSLFDFNSLKEPEILYQYTVKAKSGTLEI